ncbi:MAG: hypothetical protein IKE63_06735 [Bacilli bacterium]|nr:hypothetical protein [Bacilli bacterium]
MWMIIIIICMIVIPISIIVYKIATTYKSFSHGQSQIDVNHVNENSFQRFAKFYGETYPHEEKFDAKINQIYILIKDRGERDIKKIAETSFCSIPECVIKIKYLKNKRLIEGLYIDTNNLKLIQCSDEEQALIDKYKPYIYGTHTQIEEFVNLLPNPEGLGVEEHKRKVLEEIKYLDQKDLINGIKIDDIDGRIIYYTLEKRKAVYNKETVHCPNCGALNDVEIAGKTRCDYCKGIVIGSEFKEANEES